MNALVEVKRDIFFVCGTHLSMTGPGKIVGEDKEDVLGVRRNCRGARWSNIAGVNDAGFLSSVRRQYYDFFFS